MNKDVSEIILPGYSEFNRLVESNLYSFDKDGVICINGFECIFDSFKKIHSFYPKIETNIFEYFHKIIDYEYMNKTGNFEQYKAKYKDFIKEILPQKALELQPVFLDHYPNYSFFSDISKIFSNKQFIIKPYKKDYEYYKNKYANKKVVCINGRNAKYKHTGRNNLMHNLISQLIIEGFYVINTTIIPPQFCFTENYEEISDNMSYNEVVALYSISDCVISVQDSGGISTHLLTESNFILLPSNETWVNNKAYGYNNKSLIELRSEMGYVTKILNDNIIQFVGKQTPPIINNFSDESKILKYY